MGEWISEWFNQSMHLFILIKLHRRNVNDVMESNSLISNNEVHTKAESPNIVDIFSLRANILVHSQSFFFLFHNFFTLFVEYLATDRWKFLRYVEIIAGSFPQNALHFYSIIFVIALTWTHFLFKVTKTTAIKAKSKRAAVEVKFVSSYLSVDFQIYHTKVEIIQKFSFHIHLI